MRNLKPNALVVLKEGKYPLVDSDGIHFLEVPAGKKALLLERVGISPQKRQCWHILLEGSVILVWDDYFELSSP